MNAESAKHDEPDFLQIAQQLKLIDDETAQKILAESEKSGESAKTLVLEKGLLNSVQLDITIRSPRCVFPDPLPSSD